MPTDIYAVDNSIYDMPDIFGDSRKQTPSPSKKKKSKKSKKIQVRKSAPRRNPAPQRTLADDINATIKGVQSLTSQFSQKGSVERKREQLKRKQKHAESELSLLTEEKTYQATYDKLQKAKEKAKPAKLPPRGLTVPSSNQAEETCGLGCKIKSIFKKK